MSLRKDLSDLAPAENLEVLLAHTDERFLYCAYLTLFGRHPDETGLSTYLPRVRNGADKLEIVKTLAMSDEAREKGVDLPGLGKVRRRGLFERLTLRLKPLGLWFSSSARTSVQLRRLENRLGLHIDQVEARFNLKVNHINHLLHHLPSSSANQGPMIEGVALGDLSHRGRYMYYRLKAGAHIQIAQVEDAG